MPLYLVLTLFALAWDKRPRRAYAVAIGGFVLPAILLGPWLMAHPTALTDILSKYGVDDSSGGSIAQSLRGSLTFHAIGDQLSRLWAFFDPRFLFFDGPMELMFSTRSVGVFLLPVAVLLLIGIRGSFLGPVHTTTLVLVVGPVRRAAGGDIRAGHRCGVPRLGVPALRGSAERCRRRLPLVGPLAAAATCPLWWRSAACCWHSVSRMRHGR
jgi:hypothetical protein